MKALRRFTVRAHLPDRIAALAQLSTNLRWSWDTATQELFASIDPQQWSTVGRDPVALLGEVSPVRLDELAADDEFLERLDRLASDLNDYLTKPLWYQEVQARGDHVLPTGIGYFSMEFGVAEVLPIYSGGLGILAGDHLKAASDLGLPLTVLTEVVTGPFPLFASGSVGWLLAHAGHGSRVLSRVNADRDTVEVVAVVLVFGGDLRLVFRERDEIGLALGASIDRK